MFPTNYKDIAYIVIFASRPVSIWHVCCSLFIWAKPKWYCRSRQKLINPSAPPVKGIKFFGDLKIGVDHFLPVLRWCQYFSDSVYCFAGQISVHGDEIKCLGLNIAYENGVAIDQQRLFKWMQKIKATYPAKRGWERGRSHQGSVCMFSCNEPLSIFLTTCCKKHKNLLVWAWWS